ncbi:MAG TPA: hypothetical protein VFL94_06775 [Actinomycetales bacterium]|nr:hypothetical protein [Actinomycetales bacterium]
MTAVVAVTGLLTGGPSTVDLDRSSAQGRTKQSVDPWYDVLGSVVDEADVLVLVRSPHASAVRRRLARVRSLLDTDRIAMVDVPVGPLAAGVLADAVARGLLSGRLVPAQVPAAVRHAADLCLDVGVVRRVSDLDLPSVTLAHQLRSYLPWSSRFVVSLAPTLAVGHLAAHDTQLRGPEPALPQASGPLRALTAGTPLPAALLTLLQRAGLEAEVVQQPALHALLADAWADPGCAELVVMPAHDDEWLGTGVLPATAACTWCDRPRTSTACLFCGEWAGADEARTVAGPAA